MFHCSYVWDVSTSASTFVGCRYNHWKYGALLLGPIHVRAVRVKSSVFWEGHCGLEEQQLGPFVGEKCGLVMRWAIFEIGWELRYVLYVLRAVYFERVIVVWKSNSWGHLWVRNVDWLWGGQYSKLVENCEIFKAKKCKQEKDWNRFVTWNFQSWKRTILKLRITLLGFYAA